MDRCEDCARMKDVLFLLVKGVLVCFRCWKRNHYGAKLQEVIEVDLQLA